MTWTKDGEDVDLINIECDLKNIRKRSETRDFSGKRVFSIQRVLGKIVNEAVRRLSENVFFLYENVFRNRGFLSNIRNAFPPEFCFTKRVFKTRFSPNGPLI